VKECSASHALFSFDTNHGGLGVPWSFAGVTAGTRVGLDIPRAWKWLANRGSGVEIKVLMGEISLDMVWCFRIVKGHTGVWVLHASTNTRRGEGARRTKHLYISTPQDGV
jgi:hypothetical protein